MLGSGRTAFDWDDANTAHIARHGITVDEAEDVIMGASIPIESGIRGGEDRHTELGETASGRLILVVWTWRRRKIRVVTAFPAKRKWNALWKSFRGRNNA